MLLKKSLIGIIKLYQMMPLSTHNMCRFIPKCSDYTIQALEEYGTFKGLKLGIKRVLKCHPKGKYGYDPIPKNEKEKS